MVAGRGDVPVTGVAAVVLNVTPVSPTATTFVSVYPPGSTRTTASSVNAAAGRTVANLVIAKLGTGGRITLFNSAGATHLLVDVTGWMATGSAYTR